MSFKVLNRLLILNANSFSWFIFSADPINKIRNKRMFDSEGHRKSRKLQ